MEGSNLVPLIEALDNDIDDLEEALSPLLKASWSEYGSKLPVLDKAQLYILITYAIESMIFSYLRLNGVNAKEHPIFRELTRVKQYFSKVNSAESSGSKRNAQLDKAAAGRFIKHGLAGNDKFDMKEAERLRQAKATAAAKVEQNEKKRKRPDEETTSIEAHAQTDTTKGNEEDAKVQKASRKAEKSFARSKRKSRRNRALKMGRSRL
ncbi:MAG: hypothetical protein OHK93_006234 [Ramalina farinacea]|uniref:Exosome complex protein n=1 Tax=Ramalina farinacea TaxID=258253 RepID=A0AA43QI67_9LECA|nr:hypothetical protein [Ramalina farinacea]